MNANYHETAAAGAAAAVPMEDGGDDDNDECPDLVPVAPPTANSGDDDGRKVPVTVITGYLGRVRTEFRPNTCHLRRFRRAIFL